MRKAWKKRDVICTRVWQNQELSQEFKAIDHVVFLSNQMFSPVYLFSCVCSLPSRRGKRELSVGLGGLSAAESDLKPAQQGSWAML